MCLYVHMCVCVRVYTCLCVLVVLFACFLICLLACLLVCLFTCLLVCLPVCLLVCLCACVLVRQVREDKELPGFAFGAISNLDASTVTEAERRGDQTEETEEDNEEGKRPASLSIEELFQLSRENREYPHVMTAL